MWDGIFFHSFLYDPNVLQARTISLLCQENRNLYSHMVCLLWMKITEPVLRAEVLFCDPVKRERWWVSHPITLPHRAAAGPPAPPTVNTQSVSPLVDLGTSSALASLALIHLARSVFSFGHLLKDQIFFSEPFPDHPILNCSLNRSPSLCLILFSSWHLTLFAIVLFIYFLLCLFSSLNYDLHKGSGYSCLLDHRSTWCMIRR